jgi:hypothetical protein
VSVFEIRVLPPKVGSDLSKAAVNAFLQLGPLQEFVRVLCEIVNQTKRDTF